MILLQLVGALIICSLKKNQNFGTIRIKIKIKKFENLKTSLSLNYLKILRWKYQKQPPRGVPGKRFSENMQQIYRIIPMPKCDFNKVALQLY